MKIPFILVFILIFSLSFQSTVMAQKQQGKPQKGVKVHKSSPKGKPKGAENLPAKAGKPKRQVNHAQKVAPHNNQFPRTKVVVVKPRVRTINALRPDHTRIVYRNKPYYYQGAVIIILSIILIQLLLRRVASELGFFLSVTGA